MQINAHRSTALFLLLCTYQRFCIFILMIISSQLLYHFYWDLHFHFLTLFLPFSSMRSLLVEIALPLSTTICFLFKFTFQMSFYAFVFIFAVVFEDTQSQMKLGWPQTLVAFFVEIALSLFPLSLSKFLCLLFSHTFTSFILLYLGISKHKCSFAGRRLK